MSILTGKLCRNGLPSTALIEDLSPDIMLTLLIVGCRTRCLRHIVSTLVALGHADPQRLECLQNVSACAAKHLLQLKRQSV